MQKTNAFLSCLYFMHIYYEDIKTQRVVIFFIIKIFRWCFKKMNAIFLFLFLFMTETYMIYWDHQNRHGYDAVGDVFCP